MVQNRIWYFCREIKDIFKLYVRFTLLVVAVQFLLPLVVIIILYYRIYVYLKVGGELGSDELQRILTSCFELVLVVPRVTHLQNIQPINQSD